MSVTDTTANAHLDAIITGTLWVQLFTVAPDNNGSGGTAATEPRISCSSWTTAASRTKSNNAKITFGTPTATYTPVAAGLYDAETGGNFIAVTDTFTGAQVTSGGDPAEFDIGALTFTYVS